MRPAHLLNIPPQAPPGGRASPRPDGLTLLELLATLAVLAICISLAVPAFHILTMKNRAETATHLLTSLFATARATAVTHRRITTVCPTDGVAPVCTEDGDWSRGWLMFADSNGDRQPDGPEDVMRHDIAPIHASLRMRSSTGRPQLRYLPDGRSAGSNLTVRVCDASQVLAEITVNNGGRARGSRANTGAPCPD